jgi:hypothetical protein
MSGENLSAVDFTHCINKPIIALKLFYVEEVRKSGLRL